MKQANLTDIKLELWLRAREKGQIVWTTKNGKVIPIKDLKDTHLNNIAVMLLRKNEYCEEDAIGGDWKG